MRFGSLGSERQHFDSIDQESPKIATKPTPGQQTRPAPPGHDRERLDRSGRRRGAWRRSIMNDAHATRVDGARSQAQYGSRINRRIVGRDRREEVERHLRRLAGWRWLNFGAGLGAIHVRSNSVPEPTTGDPPPGIAGTYSVTPVPSEAPRTLAPTGQFADSLGESVDGQVEHRKHRSHSLDSVARPSTWRFWIEPHGVGEMITKHR